VREALKRVGIVVLVLVVAVGAFLFFPRGGNLSIANAATLTVLHGNVDAQKGSADFAPALDGALLTSGDVVRANDAGWTSAETALMFLGAPYEWGGVTVHGLDCSGLVQAVHRRFGMLLPHSAAEQETAGREVSLRQATTGDLLCYGDHIAIWLGEGRVVHASSEHGKVVDEPHPAELKARLRTVRRLYETED